MLIVRQRDAFFDFSGVLAAVEKDVFDTAWKKIKENPDQFTGVDGAPECRETNLKTGCNLISSDLAGGPGEDLLTGAAGGDQTTFSRTFCLERKTTDFTGKTAEQVIFKCCFFPRRIKELCRESGFRMADLDTDLGRGSKWVTLYMVDG